MAKLQKQKKFPKIILKNQSFLLITLLLLIGFFIRVYFADKFIKESGDLRLYAEWGEKFWEYGAGNFYFSKDWYYAPPNYPPLISLVYAGAYFLFDHKYVLAQIHNATKLIPSVFIVYFYENGYYLLLKLPGILADLGLALFIYNLVLRLTNNINRSLLAFIFYLFNPISIFLSGVWGQTDSLISLFGMLSFFTLFLGKIWISIPMMFISFYIKPNWGLFIPLYIFYLLINKPNFKSIFIGVFLSFIIFFITTYPFSGKNLLPFARYLLDERILPTATVTHKASVSAFNFYTILFQIDKSSDKELFLGFPVNILGLFMFSFVNIYIFFWMKRKKYTLNSLLLSIFIIGFSGYLFLTNMLERYFFASFIPLIIIAFSELKIFKYLMLISLTTFSNVVYSFFRRSVGEVADFFTDNNFLIIRILSSLSLYSWFLVLKKVCYNFNREGKS